MKTFSSLVLFALLQGAANGFVVAPRSVSTAAAVASSSSTTTLTRPALPGDLTSEWVPLDMEMERIEGGKMVRTYKMPPGVERLQYVFKTDGRPLKARAELWLGPNRRTHYMVIDSMNGKLTPYRGTLKFKAVAQVLRIATTHGPEFPIWAGVYVPSSERSKEIKEYTEGIFEEGPRMKVQGGSVSGGGGQVRTWVFGDEVEAVQVVCWSINVGKKSFKAYMEVYQGPGEPRQTYDLQCGGGSQPYHAVFEIPEGGAMIRMKNKKFLEDGLFEAVVTPYKMRSGSSNGPMSTSSFNQPYRVPLSTSSFTASGDIRAGGGVAGSAPIQGGKIGLPQPQMGLPPRSGLTPPPPARGN